jgi:hypothetical protein
MLEEAYHVEATAALTLLGRLWLEKITYQLWNYAESLNDWLHELSKHPAPDWRERLEAFIAEQEAAGFILSPESHADLVAYLENWAGGNLVTARSEPSDSPEVQVAAHTSAKKQPSEEPQPSDNTSSGIKFPISMKGTFEMYGYPDNFGGYFGEEVDNTNPELAISIGSAILGAILEPVDWFNTGVEIKDDPTNPLSYAGLLPIVPAGAGRLGKKIANEAGDAAADGARTISNIASDVPTPRGQGGLVPTVKGNIPQADKWIRNGGRVIYNADGSMIYIKDGISIRYNSIGYPDFTSHLYGGGDGLNHVRIELTGNYASDFNAANSAAGFTNTPKGYTWHHHEDVGLMQLVDTRVHSLFWHSGGMSLSK